MSPMITGRPWTLAEDDVIRALYFDKRGPFKCVDALQGRTLRSVYQRAAKLGLKRWRPWTEKDLATLRDEWGELTLRELAKQLKQLGRSEKGVFEAVNLIHALKAAGR